jgi:hypothetical protein
MILINSVLAHADDIDDDERIPDTFNAEELTQNEILSDYKLCLTKLLTAQTECYESVRGLQFTLSLCICSCYPSNT